MLVQLFPEERFDHPFSHVILTNFFQGTAGTKIEALENANVIVSRSPAQMGTLLVGAMKSQGLA